MRRTEGSGGLDETLPSGSENALEETLPSGDHGASPITKATGPSPGDSLAHVERGTIIGRYTVIERVGSGTMGLVLAAFDATLDRKVAIKLVQLDRMGTTSGRQRLLREAQAMAKLQHPNVVTVFEVGTFKDRVFLAMEFVDGETLHDWLAKPTRSHREIIAAFSAAGRGLAAAHRAGIVHRDFKPANVLVGKDGRVRVADFGLATAPTDAPPPPVEVSRESDPGPLGMTKTGAVLGTPAYMSPEQHRGAAADSRADQFSFCVALYEALYEVLPFEGATFLVYQENVLAGRVRDPARGSDVPARVRRVLLRGLAPTPTDRYPDMDALLDDLANDAAAKWRRVALFGSAVIAVGGLAFAVARTTSGGDPCATADQPVANVWNAAQKKALEDSFRASGSPGAATAFAHVSRMLDERVKALRAARREACVATSVRHEQSAELLDKRIRCVDERAAATTALITVMTENHDAGPLMKGIDGVMSLPSVDACSDSAALLSSVAPPPPAQRAQIAAIETRVANADAFLMAGMRVKALDKLNAIVRESDAIGYPPLSASVHSSLADAHLQLDHTEQAVAELRKTGELAAAAHDDNLAARSWINLFATIGSRQGKLDEARGIEQVAAAAVVRAGSTADLLGDLEHARAMVALWREEYEPSARHFQAAATHYEKAGRYRLSQLAGSLSAAGTSLVWASKYDEARPLLDKALAIRIEGLGPEHPDVAYSHHDIGILLDSVGKPEEALEHFEKSATIMARAFPPDNSNNAKALSSLGLVLGELERTDEALAAQKRAVEIFEMHPEDNRQYMGLALVNLGFAYLSARQSKESLATFQRALAVAEQQSAPDSDDVARVLGGLMAAADETGDHAKALEYGKRALALREKKLGPDHEDVSRVLGDLAQNANLRGKPQEAMPLIDRALAIIEKPGAPELAVRFEMRRIRAVALVALRRADAAVADAKLARDGYLASKQPAAAASAQVVLADALWLQGKRADAIREAQAALDTVKAQPHPDPEVLADAKAWLAKHPK